MTRNHECTCTTTALERHLDRQCPAHGDRAEARRHARTGRPRNLDELAELTTDAVEFGQLFDSLPPAGQRYVEMTMAALVNDPDGSVLELLKRHERGERVADVYFNAETGDQVRLAEGAPVPRRHFPVLGCAV